MKLAVVGVGNAGSRVANRILEVEAATGRNLSGGNALLFNTSPPSFDAAEQVPEERQVMIGDVHRDVNGDGTDGDPELGAEVARDDSDEILRAFDAIEFFEIDGVLVVAGLGGGTGGGAGAVVIDEIQNICDDPIYALGILPSEAEGSVPALTASRSLQSFVDRADNVVAFDNEAWRDAQVTAEDAYLSAADGRYERVNEALATRVVTLFAAGEVAGPTAAENRMDPSDLMRTLDTGGLSSIGYAASEVEPEPGGLLSWLRSLPLVDRWFSPATPTRGEVIQKDDEVESPEDEDEEAEGEVDTTSAARIERLVRRAVRSTLTLPCDVSSADRALVLLSGPSRELSRKGFETSRYWLEGEADTVEVMAGDEPHEGARELTATVLLSNVTDVPRIEAMQNRAAAALDREADGPGEAGEADTFEMGGAEH